MNLTDHTTVARSILYLNNLRNLVETKTSESTLLINWSTDFTLNLLDFNCCHIRFFLINR